MKATQLKYTVCTVDDYGIDCFLRRRLATFASLADAENYARTKKGAVVVESARIDWRTRQIRR